MIERVFLGWDEPVLPAAARFLARRGAKGDALDLKGTALVVPGARAGRRLKELLLVEAGRAGLRLAPPRVVTTGALPELFLQPGVRRAPPLVVRQAWAETLRRADPSSLSLVFTDPPRLDDPIGWDRLGAQLATVQREVAGGAHRFADVAAICGRGDLAFDDSPRWRILAAAQERYEGLLAAHGFVDPDLARIDALRGGPVAAALEVWLVGVSELPRVARALLLRAATPVGALIHAPPEEAASFDETGCVEPSAWRERRIPIDASHVQVVDRPADQAAELLRQASLLGDEHVPDMAIGVPDPRLVPYVEEWFAAAGLTTHYAGGSTVDRSDPYRLLEAVADYLDRPGWEEFAALVRHPRVEARLRSRPPTFAGGMHALGPLDRYFQRHLPAEVRASRGGGAEGGEVERVRRMLESDELLGRFAGKRPLNLWGEPVLSFLVEVYAGRDLNPNDPAARRLAEVLGTIRGAALEIHRLPPGLAPVTEAAPAIRLLADLIGGEVIAEEGEPDSIELLGWLEIAMDDAPIALVAGFNEGTLPVARNADPFLPDQLRTRLGLLDNAGRYGRDAFLLTALARSRRAVRLISGRITAEGDPLRPSRLALTSRGVELAEAIRALQAPARTGAAPSSPLVDQAGDRSDFHLPPLRDLALDPPTELRVTDFAVILEDPYRYLLERQLRLERVGDEAREMDGSEFGSFAHVVLRRFGHSTEAHSTDIAAIRRRLDTLVDEETAARFGQLTFPAVRLQAEQLRVRLHVFAAWQAARVAEGWRIVLVEGQVAGAGDVVADRAAPAPFDVDGETVLLTGRIDRVDHHAETNRFAILDYKTGDKHPIPEETHRKKQSGEWKDLQLPLYRHLLAHARAQTGEPLLPRGAIVELGYVALSRELSKIGVEMADWDADLLLTADEAAREVVRTLRTGVISFDRSRTRTWEGDDLASLLGLRLLLTAGGDADDEEDAE